MDRDARGGREDDGGSGRGLGRLVGVLRVGSNAFVRGWRRSSGGEKAERPLRLEAGGRRAMRVASQTVPIKSFFAQCVENPLVHTLRSCPSLQQASMSAAVAFSFDFLFSPVSLSPCSISCSRSAPAYHASGLYVVVADPSTRVLPPCDASRPSSSFSSRRTQRHFAAFGSGLGSV